ncbi:acyl carrier protein [Ruegeria sp. MALMAid1280]|uniref:acyl carrier protein n=1 Tax=Ruegeria sp. MALMAid1280 TaxID=3411634 RepID=UPI003BA1D40F
MSKPANFDEVLDLLKQYLEEDFEVPPQDVQPDARLYEDLDLDSIDAVDLIVRFQRDIGKRFSAEEFKSARTVKDVVDVVVANL